MKKLFSFIVLLSALLFSCKKEEPQLSSKALTILEISRLGIGNWWAYSASILDSTGTTVAGILGSGRDTLTIIGDTIIRGNSYFIRSGTMHGGTITVRDYLRDSADCLINGNGQILFRVSHFDQAFRRDTMPGVYTSEYTVDRTTSYVTTGIGTKQCYILNVTYQYDQYGTRLWHYKYCPYYGLGKWMENDPTQPNPIEQRLMACHFEN